MLLQYILQEQTDITEPQGQIVRELSQYRKSHPVGPSIQYAVWDRANGTRAWWMVSMA